MIPYDTRVPVAVRRFREWLYPFFFFILIFAHPKRQPDFLSVTQEGTGTQNGRAKVTDSNLGESGVAAADNFAQGKTASS